MPAASRLGGHIRLLGILWIALSAFRVIPGLVLIALFHHDVEFGPPPLVCGLLRGVAVALILGALLGLLAGVGLLQRQSWARMLAIVVGVVGLVDMPFGTALGIYTLWVLLPARSEEEYRQIAGSA
jgi:hypothetical protein